jgi:hypothetical protein
MATVANQVHSTAQQLGARIGANPIDATRQPPTGTRERVEPRPCEQWEASPAGLPVCLPPDGRYPELHPWSFALPLTGAVRLRRCSAAFLPLEPGSPLVTMAMSNGYPSMEVRKRQ